MIGHNHGSIGASRSTIAPPEVSGNGISLYKPTHRRAARWADSNSQAVCIGEPDTSGCLSETDCPHHWPSLYAETEARHRADDTITLRCYAKGCNVKAWSGLPGAKCPGCGVPGGVWL